MTRKKKPEGHYLARITISLHPETLKRWQKSMEEENFTTLSEMIRYGMDYWHKNHLISAEDEKNIIKQIFRRRAGRAARGRPKNYYHGWH